MDRKLLCELDYPLAILIDSPLFKEYMYYYSVSSMKVHSVIVCHAFPLFVDDQGDQGPLPGNHQQI